MVRPNRDHGACVGSSRELNDFEGPFQFNLLTLFGLRKQDRVLDIGGASRASTGAV